MQLSIRPSGAFLVLNPTKSKEIEFADVTWIHGIGSGLLFLDSHPNLCESLPELNYWLDFTRLFLGALLSRSENLVFFLVPMGRS